MNIIQALRKTSWLLRILGVAVLSRIQRMGRRLLGKPPRIVHGTAPMHIMQDMVRADRLAGFHSISIVKDIHFAKYALVKEQEFDVVLSARYAADECHWASAYLILKHADIWVTFFDSYFFPSSADLRSDWLFGLIKWAGIRLIAIPNGLDVAHLDRKASRYDWLDKLRLDYPAWDLQAETPSVKARIERFSRCADLVIGGDTMTERFLPSTDFTFKYFPVTLERFHPEVAPANRIPVIVHAPNHRNIKGTQFLIAAVESLQRRGIECDLRLVEGVPRGEAVRLYARADVIADQFVIGSYGVFAIEGLMLGKAVLAYLDEETLHNPALNLPIINTNPENLERVLEVLIQMPILRERLGSAGRGAAQKYQSCEALAEVWARIYNHVWSATPLNLDETVHFGKSRISRSVTEDPANADFWPVPVEDVLGRIKSVLQQRAPADRGC